MKRKKKRFCGFGSVLRKKNVRNIYGALGVVCWQKNKMGVR